MTPADPDDQALMERVKQGDRQAFESLYSRHGPPIMRFLYRLCADRALAEDLTQDVFLKVWHAAAGWRPLGRVSTWLFQIAKYHWWNEAAKHKRRRPIRGSQVLPAEDAAPDDPDAPTPGEALARAESAAAVEAALAELSPKLRVVFVLVRLEGVSYAETAEIVGIPVGTVKSRAAAAEAWLRRHLRDALEP